MTNMDLTKPMVDSETVKVHQDMLPKMTQNSTYYCYNQ